MKFLSIPSALSGAVEIPGSKSHTIRALFFAMLADGESEILAPLASADTRAAFAACRAFGADIKDMGDRWIVKGVNGKLRSPEEVVDVANSGTTIRLALGAASLCGAGKITLTGDKQIQRRPIGELAAALNNLGAEVSCEKNTGCPPVTVSKPVRGGFTTLKSPTSQFLTSLLVSLPLAPEDSTIEVIQLNEHPYIDITLWWLDRQGIKYERDGYERFKIFGGQKYESFASAIPADFSSATFFAVAAAITKSKVTLKGLDMTDPQGDKAVLKYLSDMGAVVSETEDGITVQSSGLRGIDIDMNATPDALPAMAVAACFAEGETRLLNVPQARIKETDRIAVMAAELSKMGADIRELADGLVIRGGGLTGAEVEGHDDHRVVMSMAMAGLAAKGETIVNSAEAAGVTFPDFREKMISIGADISESDN